MVSSELEELRAEVALLREQLAAKAIVPELPAEHDGEAITWRPWEEVPIILCHRAGDLNACPQCAHPGPSVQAFGLAGPGLPVIRFVAGRCPSCQEMRVYHRWHEKYRIGAEMDLIAYHPPRTIARTSQEA